jgi:hypothetical protein
MQNAPRAIVIALLVLVASVAVAPVASALDVAPWDRVLRTYARRGGLNYAGLAADPAARADLDLFLASVATMPESEPLYAWLNAYNAVVVKSVLARYPLRSVRDVPGFFDRAQHRVAGQMRTLDQIENQIVRPRFHDARVHVALNCAARSCPALASRAFTAGNVDASLTRLARSMIANDTHVRFRNGTLELSPIFTWFAADFVRDAGSVRAWITRYDERGKHTAVPANAPTRERVYDWRLNE